MPCPGRLDAAVAAGVAPVDSNAPAKGTRCCLRLWGSNHDIEWDVDLAEIVPPWLVRIFGLMRCCGWSMLHVASCRLLRVRATIHNHPLACLLACACCCWRLPLLLCLNHLFSPQILTLSLCNYGRLQLFLFKFVCAPQSTII